MLKLLVSATRKYRLDLAALAAYILLAVLLTFPLLLHFTTRVAGDGSDDPALAWNLWWVPYAIVHLNTSPIFTNYMFYPIGLDLAYYTLTYLNAFLGLPLQLAFNLVVAANANLWLSFVLGGYGTFLLARYLLRRGAHDAARVALDPTAPAAFAAGALYAFASNKLLYASLGQFNIASSHWIPFFLLFLLKLTDLRQEPVPFRESIRLGSLLGLFLLFQALSEFIFASFLIIFAALYLVYWLVANRGRMPACARRLPGLAAASLVFLVPMVPILSAMIRDALVEGDFIQQGAGFSDVFSSDLLGFFVPSPLNPLFRGLATQFHFAYTNFAFVGFIALAFAVLAIWKDRRARLWGVFAAIFALISLGPDLRVDGRAFNAPFLPFNFLLEMPFVKGNRYPSRWSVMVMLAVAVLAAYGIAWLVRWGSTRYRAWGRLPPGVWSAVLAAALLFEHLSVPLPLSDMRIPAVYATIAQDKGDYAVLEIPLGWRNGFGMMGTLDQAMMFAQWYQTVQGHPLLGGNTSRNPELKFQYFARAPVLQSLIAVETGHSLDGATLAADRELAPSVLRFFGVRYVVWHSPRNADNRRALDAARAYVEQTWPIKKFSDVVDETGETIAYRVDNAAEPNEYTVDPQDPMAKLNFAEGWGTLGGPIVWATRREARLFLQIGDDAASEQVLSLRAFSPIPNQSMHVIVNDQRVGGAKLSQGWGEYSVSVPREAWNPGMNEIRLQFGALVPPAQVRQGDYIIGTTGVRSPVSIVASSAGKEVGDLAHIYVDGRDVALDSRGYNVAVIDPRTGAVEPSAAFDTFQSVNESARLARFIAQIPAGRIVVAVVRDEASRELTADAVAALRSIGAATDLRGRFRWSHAVIGVKGAAPASAQEASSETSPVDLTVGVGATEPDVAAAIEWIKVVAK